MFEEVERRAILILGDGWLDSMLGDRERRFHLVAGDVCGLWHRPPLEKQPAHTLTSGDNVGRSDQHLAERGRPSGFQVSVLRMLSPLKHRCQAEGHAQSLVDPTCPG